jgi:hypothetical protein
MRTSFAPPAYHIRPSRLPLPRLRGVSELWHNRRMRIALCLAVTVVLFLAPAGAGAKRKHQGGVRECQQRVADKIQSDHPPSRGSWFDSDVERTPLGNNAVTISGRGRVKTAKGKKRGFSYSCVYNHRSGKLSKVKYLIR